MANKRMDRKDIRQPDPFVTFINRAAERVAPNMRYIGIGVIALLVVAAVAWGFQFRADQETARLNARLQEAIELYDRNMQDKLIGAEPAWGELDTILDELYGATQGHRIHAIVLLYTFNSFVAQGDLDAATGMVPELEAAAEDEPKLLSTVYYEMGQAHELAGNMQAAVELYEQAANVVPNPYGNFLEGEIERAKRGRLPASLIDRYVPGATADTGEDEREPSGRIILDPDDLK